MGSVRRGARCFVRRHRAQPSQPRPPWLENVTGMTACPRCSTAGHPDARWRPVRASPHAQGVAPGRPSAADPSPARVGGGDRHGGSRPPTPAASAAGGSRLAHRGDGARRGPRGDRSGLRHLAGSRDQCPPPGGQRARHASSGNRGSRASATPRSRVPGRTAARATRAVPGGRRAIGIGPRMGHRRTALCNHHDAEAGSQCSKDGASRIRCGGVGTLRCRDPPARGGI
jgi:hypothetical protein